MQNGTSRDATAAKKFILLGFAGRRRRRFQRGGLALPVTVCWFRPGGRADAPEQQACDDAGAGAGEEPSEQDDGKELQVHGLGCSVAEAHGNCGACDAVGG